MASDVEELSTFLQSLGVLFNQIQRSLSTNDPVCMDILKRKLDDNLSIVVAMSMTVSSRTDSGYGEEMHLGTGHSLSTLLEALVENMEVELGKLSEILEKQPAGTEEREIISMFPSNGGRPAYNITKNHIESLRETGMYWRTIADFLGVSGRMLHRSRVEYAIEARFSDISDSDLDKNIHKIFELTPNSGESYVRGSLKARGVRVQRSSVRRSLRQVDPVDRIVEESVLGLY